MVSRKACQKEKHQILEVDGLQHLKNTLGSTSVGQEQEFEATLGTGSPRLETWRLQKHAWFFFFFFSNLQSSSFIEPVCVMFCDWSGSVMCHTFSYSGSRKSFGSTRTLNWINNSRQVCCFIRILPFTRPVLPYKSCNAHMVWKTDNEPQHTQKNDHKAEDKRVNKEKEVNDRRWR